MDRLLYLLDKASEIDNRKLLGKLKSTNRDERIE